MFALLAWTVPLAAHAQLAGGAISGQVVDPQGLALPGVAISVEGEGWVSATATTEAGRFRVPNVPPGAYAVRFERTGFAGRTEQVTVGIGAALDLQVALALAGVTATAEVEAHPVDRADAIASTRLVAADLARIPTTRDVFTLARSTPGVLLDRVNVAGAETGQQSGLSSKGTRPFDTTWTIDGVVVTDMAAAGSSPLYFNLDNVEEMRFTTSGQDIRQPTGGLGVDVVMPRGTNALRGGARIDAATRGMEGTNLPGELASAGATRAQTDHTERLVDAGVFGGGPLVRDRLWFHASYAVQDVRLVRSQLADRTQLRNPSVKLTWRASSRDVVSGLYFDGDKLKEGRPPSGTANLLFPAATALQNQHNAYAAGPFHGLWKLTDDHTFAPGLVASVTLAYLNTGFELAPAGGMDLTSGRSVRLSRSFGSTVLTQNVRPQWNVSGEVTSIWRGLGSDHLLQAGGTWRRVDARSRTLWPGNGLLALDNSATDKRVRVFREGRGANRTESASVFAQHTVQRGPWSVSGGLRVDHQAGASLAGRSAPNPTFPDLVPGTDYAGARLPFTWNTLSPRVSASRALGARRPFLLRAAFSRFAGQLPTAIAAAVNPSTSVGFREFRWNDANGDQLASADEVLLSQQLQVGGGLNPAALTTPSAASPNRLGTLDPPRTTSAVAGFDVDLLKGVVFALRYSQEKATGVFGVTQTRLGVGRGDYLPGPPVRGTLPDGRTYDVATWVPNPQAIAAGGGGFELGSWPDYFSAYRGLEASLERRLSGRFGGRIAVSLNDAYEQYGDRGRYDLFGNPTPTETEPLIDGGAYAPQSGQMFLHARWQVDGTGTLRLPAGLDASGALHARQGYPFVPFVSAALGADVLPVLVTPAIDTYRYPAVRLVDLRIARRFRSGPRGLDLALDVFNLFNANTSLVRVRNAAAANYRQLTSYVSPRIAKISLRATF